MDEYGLSRVLSEWSGVGTLFRTLAEVSAPKLDRAWSAKDIERRASRILLLECAPQIRRLPKTARAWFDHLPTLTSRTRYWSASPATRVDWRKTRIRGWPPTSFAIRRRHRTLDQLSLTVLAWTLSRLGATYATASSLNGSDPTQSLPADILDVLACALPLTEYLDEPSGFAPTRDDLAAVRGAGWPWRPIAAIADFFIAVDRGGAEAMARRLLRPDGFPDTLFQLGVLGAIINASESIGYTVTSLRPLASMTQGPAYSIQSPTGEQWDLWCEAATCWEHYGARDIYREMAQELTALSGDSFPARHIRPDILLAKRSEQALIIECKFPFETADPGYVAQGLYQASFYAQQLASAFKQVSAYSVGPNEIVPTLQAQYLGRTQVGLASSSDVETIIRRMLS